MKPINFYRIKKVAAICLIFLVSSMTPGCIRDDLSVCGLRVMFRYVERNAPQDVNLFASDVKQVSLFVFDANTGLFLSEHSATVDQMLDSCMLSINIFPGDYDFIAWGNITEDYEIEPFVEGVTTRSEAILTLKTQGNLVEDYPDDLFYGSQNYTVIPDIQANQLITIDMVNNAKRIHVIAHGLYDDNSIQNADPYAPVFHTTILSRNGQYRFDNNPTGEHYTYVPRERLSVEEVTLLSDFVVLREMNNANATDSRLRIVHRPTKQSEEEEEFYDVSLTELLLIVASGDIESRDEFTVELFVSRTNGTVTIKVNDWTQVPVPGGSLGTGVI
jgi:hypothetical protein